MGIIFIDVLLFLCEEDHVSFLMAEEGQKWKTRQSYKYFKRIALPRQRLLEYRTIERDEYVFEQRFVKLGLRWTTLQKTRPGHQQDFRQSFRNFFKLNSSEQFRFSSPSSPQQSSEEGAGYAWPLMTTNFVGRIGIFPLDFHTVNGEREFVYRKMYWGIVGPYLPLTNEFVIKYTDLQCIRWKANYDLIFQYLYDDERAPL
jgi:hypothetical protein